MLRKILTIIIFAFLFSSCTGLKQFGSVLNKQSATTPAREESQNQPASIANSGIKFLNEFSVSAQPVVTQVTTIQSNNLVEPVFLYNNSNTDNSISDNTDLKKIVVPAPLQLKYAALLEAGANEIRHIRLFEFIDDWYGTRYRLGGTTKRGIDCSALVQLLFSDIYNINVPRTSKEQYKYTRRISTSELQEGDLLFFHTRGRGISHVGVYLQNNKFFHAASSGGVMISDMDEVYFAKRFIAAGRVVN